MNSLYSLKKQRAEERQLERLMKAKEKGRYKGYLLVLFLLILLVDVIDNITTSAPGNITSSFLTEFFINGSVFGKTFEATEEGLAGALSLHNTVNLVGYLIAMATPFYKSLADKYGRKPLFVISTIGMALGLLVVFYSTSYLMFMIGNFIMSFFLGHDIQIIYILEEAPSKHRAKIYSLIKGLGGLSCILIPLMRRLMMHDNDALWRNIFIIPAVLGIIIGILVLLFAKESKIYLEERSAYLSIPLGKRLELEEKEKLEKKQSSQKTGIFNAIKYIFKRKDLRTLIIIKSIFDAAIIAVLNYEPIMKESGMLASDITSALYYYPIIYCVSVIFSGFFADKIGRKKTIVIFGFISFLSFIFFVISTRFHWSNLVVGLMYGLYLGGYWIGRDYMEIVSTEMVPTEIRASIVGAEGLLVYVGQAVGFLFVNIGINFMPIWLTCLIFIVPCVSVSVILFLIKIKETKGIDYESIKE